jgi:cation diffusion facilitator CzcD-associated flavoprotein CzcO
MTTLIIGAGTAGLACAATLKGRGVDTTLVEKADGVGAAWRGHYDRLHLHTAKEHSGLPGLPMPVDYPRYPSRDQVVDYLEGYARHHGIEPRFGIEVTGLRPTDDGWRAQTSSGEELEAERVVVASGLNRAPHIPAWPGRDDFEGQVLHSGEYKTGAPFAGQKVLVVGFGNSGGEIAIDLVESGAERVALAVRGEVNVLPKEVLGQPILAIGIPTSFLPPRIKDALTWPLVRLTVGDITQYGLRKAPYGPSQQIAKDGRIPLIDIGTMALIKSGDVAVRPGIERFTAEGVEFTGGDTEAFDVVVLATGWEARVDRFLDVDDLDERGCPRVSGAEMLPGLFVCGFYTSPNGMIREACIEAERIAALIAG